MHPDLRRIKKFTEAFGPSGYEKAVVQLVKEELDKNYSFSRDGFGNQQCLLKKSFPKESTEKESTEKEPVKQSLPKVCITAHLDEVGFIVNAITQEGLLKIHPLGAWWECTLMAQRMWVQNRQGKSFLGTVATIPPHLLPKNKTLDMSGMAVDVGAEDRQQVYDWGINVGDFVAPATEFAKTNNSQRFMAKALDNRLGVALTCDVLRYFAENGQGENLQVEPYGLFTLQEEMGLRGAQFASRQTLADFIIVLEAPPADDTFSSDRQGVLNKGTQVRFFDRLCIANTAFADWTLDLAKDCKIPAQRAVRTSGATDNGYFQYNNRGAASIVLGIPTRYIHSHNGIFDWRDYQHTRNLVIRMIKNLTAQHIINFQN